MSEHSFTVRPQIPLHLLRHKSSLEHVLSFTLSSPPPKPHEIAEATLLYHRILDECERDGIVLRKPAGDSDETNERHDVARDEAMAELDELDREFAMIDDDDDEVEPPADAAVPLHRIFRAVFDYSPTIDGQVNLVRVILHGLFPVADADSHPDSEQLDRSLGRILPRARLWLTSTPAAKESVYRTLAAFAADFLEGFFVPLKAQGRCTPSVSTLFTPISNTEPDADQGTNTRLGNLRRLCLARDGNRCVLTRKLDSTYLHSLYQRTGRRPRGATGVKTEAAHIIPHSLNALAGASTSLHPSKCTVWRILNMFSPGISRSLAGPLIDSPANAMMLIPELHDRFGRLQCYLEAVPGVPHTYTFHTTRGAGTIDPAFAPLEGHVVFANHERAGEKAPLPSPNLIAIHRACCLMLAMSGAAEYVECLVRDMEALMERGVMKADGSSNFGLLMRFRGLKEEVEGVGWRGSVTVC